MPIGAAPSWRRPPPRVHRPSSHAPRPMHPDPSVRVRPVGARRPSLRPRTAPIINVRSSSFGAGERERRARACCCARGCCELTHAARCHRAIATPHDTAGVGEPGRTSSAPRAECGARGGTGPAAAQVGGRVVYRRWAAQAGGVPAQQGHVARLRGAHAAQHAQHVRVVLRPGEGPCFSMDVSIGFSIGLSTGLTIGFWRAPSTRRGLRVQGAGLRRFSVDSVSI